MNKVESGNLREAIAAQILSEVDELLLRLESLQAKVASSEAQLLATATALDQASGRFRLAVHEFTEQAKAELGDHFGQLSASLSELMGAQFDERMKAAAIRAFEGEVLGSKRTGNGRLPAAPQTLGRSRWSRLIENGMIAFAAALAASLLTYGFVPR